MLRPLVKCKIDPFSGGVDQCDGTAGSSGVPVKCINRSCATSCDTTRLGRRPNEGDDEAVNAELGKEVGEESDDGVVDVLDTSKDEETSDEKSPRGFNGSPNPSRTLSCVIAEDVGDSGLEKTKQKKKRQGG